jgi:hypothetical protein
MLYNSKNFLALIFLCLLSSCYHKELQYSVDPSYGGAVAGSSCYYLANIREFRMPKGISTIPDGGSAKEVRHLFGLFKTDTLTNSTILVTRIGEVVGWPSRYSSRLEKSSSYIAIGIINVTMPDSISGVYLLNLKTEKLEKYLKEGALPALSKSGTLVLYCHHNKLVVEDYLTRNKLFSYFLNFEPVFVTWKSENEIYLFISNPFRVKVLNISTGVTSNTGERFIKNFDQQVGIHEIHNFMKSSPEDLKELLDKYH